ncbi:tyrosine--tRNA ligase [Nitrosopumilus maritimus]|uniref:Tyrosine--tRNA ligase n=1 Tax=Nitrosopumilus maritimus (strain SCM1) TaxID=436308 RepID=A9A2X0_NITMS|nr:tyrosine--tRNA ligase [Nitrosopumilus maritimus]ABX13647.1 tyrosyl-tRNA synthetase [Nitrosopumilus maritimus SCM1]
MDITEKVDLIERPPTEEVVTRDELTELFKTNSSPKHYIGLEISGFLHLGSLISTGFKINDFAKAGVKCTIFLADWHTLINDKLGGNWETISKVSKYYQDAFKLVCPDAEIILGSKLYEEKTEYWSELVKFTKHMSLARTMRTLTIMGRSENEEKIDVAKLLYPAMQAVDIHSLEVDIAHAGMDQRKIHMLVREIFPKMKWKVPVAVHHKLLPGLSKPADTSDSQVLGKMSKSDPNSGVFIHNTDEEIKKKMNKAWCEEANIQNNPLLEIAKTVIFHEFNEMNVERSEKFGGNVSYQDYNQLEIDFAEKKLHPGDLKQTVGNYLVKIISPIRDKLDLTEELHEAIKKSY